MFKVITIIVNRTFALKTLASRGVRASVRPSARLLKARTTMAASVRSAFDIAYWFLDAALGDRETLQPQKLQRLLYIAQGYHAALHNGRKLMPAVFVADELGPVEPNIFAALSHGRPDVTTELFLDPAVQALLRGVWRRFGHKSPTSLDQLATETPAYREAWHRGAMEEIWHKAIWWSFAKAGEVPNAREVVRPTVLKTQSGRPVSVQPWQPRSAPALPRHG